MDGTNSAAAAAQQATVPTTRRLSSQSWQTEAPSNESLLRSHRKIQPDKARPKEWKESPAVRLVAAATETKYATEDNDDDVSKAQAVAGRMRLSWDSGSEDDDIRSRRVKEENVCRAVGSKTTPRVVENDAPPPRGSNGASTQPSTTTQKRTVRIPRNDIRLSTDPDVRHFLMLIEAHMGGGVEVRDENAWSILSRVALVQENNRTPWIESHAHQYICLLLQGQVEEASRNAVAAIGSAAVARQETPPPPSSDVPSRPATVCKREEVEQPSAVSDTSQQTSACSSQETGEDTTSNNESSLVMDDDPRATAGVPGSLTTTIPHGTPFYASLIAERVPDYSTGNKIVKADVVQSILEDYQEKEGADDITIAMIENDLELEVKSGRQTLDLPIVSWSTQRRNTSGYKLYRQAIQNYTPKYKSGDERVRLSLVDEIAAKFVFKDKRYRLLRREEVIDKITKAFFIELGKSPETKIPQRTPFYTSLIAERVSDYNTGNRIVKAEVVRSILEDCREKEGADGITIAVIEKDLELEVKSGGHTLDLPIVSWSTQRRNTSGYKLYRRTIQSYTPKYKTGDETVRLSLVNEVAAKFIFKGKRFRLLRREEVIDKVTKAFVNELGKGPLLSKKKRASDDAGQHREPKVPRTCKPEAEPVVSKLVDPLFLTSPYIEEVSYHAYRGVNSADGGMPPPEEFIPDFPSDLSVSWSYDPLSRVVMADFTKTQLPAEEHVETLLRLMERDDITVVSEGLHASLSGDQEKCQFLQYFESAFRNTDAPYHKFRRFDRGETDDVTSYHEVDGHVKMTIPMYLTYLEMHKRGPECADNCNIAFVDSFDKMHSVDARTVVLYMVDADMPRYFHAFNNQYKGSFKVPEVLLGSDCCLLGYIPEQSRPFMGPNLYVTPGGGFTSFHQDGFGTVDSGHSCLAGYNEVVMLRRLPEIHKMKACSMVPTRDQRLSGEEVADNTLFRMPHDDGRKDTPLWPTKATVEEWTSLNYCPSVFILKPGQHLHINKGRLHAFRKLTVAPLPEDDCHADLRSTLVQEITNKGETLDDLCISVAYDWMYLGVSAEAINREVATTIEAARRCRQHETAKSLAIVESTVMFLAGTLKSPPLPLANSRSCNIREIASGILPSMRYLITKENATSDGFGELEDVPGLTNGVTLTSDNVPDSYYDPQVHPIDPFGNDYFCKTCSHELANVYYHCNGCESMLGLDFNICGDCYNEGKFLQTIRMREYGGMTSDNHHMGGTVDNLQSRKCGCHQGVCKKCITKGICKRCSCTCHKKFTRRLRFRTIESGQRLLKDCEEVANGKEVQFACETLARLNEQPVQLQFPVTPLVCDV